MNRTRIKICGIRRIEDMTAAAEAGADAVGLVFYPSSPRSIDTEAARELLRVVPPFVTTVGLFVNPTEDMVRSVLDVVSLDMLQFHGQESPSFCSQFGRPYIKALPMGDPGGASLKIRVQGYVEASGLLLDSHVTGGVGGSGKVFDWQRVPEDLSIPVVLAGGLNADNVGRAVRDVRPYAVDVSSGVEVAPGEKDFQKILRFVEEVNHADAELYHE